MTTPLAILTVLAYAASLALYFRLLYTSQVLVGRAATLLLACGLGLHYLLLLERSRTLHSVPYQDLYGAMSLFAWLLALTYLGLELFHRQRTLGAFLLPFVLLILLAATLARPDVPPGPPPVHGAVFALHVTLSILAYAAFGLSFVLSLMFIAEETLLRRHKLGSIVWRFPALELLERMARSSVLLGLLAICAGMFLGFLSVDRLTGRVWRYDPKYLVTLLVVALYVAYLYLGRTTKWRGARASKLCIFNFVVILLSATVVNLFLSRWHRFF
ncbi:MAG: cytochrome c biogenesis protein [Acidobacteriia bacterium]|nr:cytochrome c biogenesis protein [Terriglobia bacterium]